MIDIETIARVHGEAVRAGSASTTLALRPAVQALEHEHNRALADDKAKIPTTLSLAIIGVLAAVREERVNAYANAMAKADQVDPYRNRPDLDWTTHGTPAKAGA